MGEMAARDDLEGQGEGIMDEERDTGMAAMSRKDRRALVSQGLSPWRRGPFTLIKCRIWRKRE